MSTAVSALPVKAAATGGELLACEDAGVAKSLTPAAVLAEQTGHTAAHAAMGLIKGFSATPNRTTLGAPDPTTGLVPISTPQDGHTNADVAYKSLAAQIVQRSNTPVVSTQAGGAGTGSPAINAQPDAGTSTFGLFEITFGTNPSAAAAFARLTFAAGLTVTSLCIGKVCGEAFMVDYTTGVLLSTGYLICNSANQFDVFMDKAAAVPTATHAYVTYKMFPF